MTDNENKEPELAAAEDPASADSSPPAEGVAETAPAAEEVSKEAPGEPELASKPTEEPAAADPPAPTTTEEPAAVETTTEEAPQAAAEPAPEAPPEEVPTATEEPAPDPPAEAMPVIVDAAPEAPAEPTPEVIEIAPDPASAATNTAILDEEEPTADVVEIAPPSPSSSKRRHRSGWERERRHSKSSSKGSMEPPLFTASRKRRESDVTNSTSRSVEANELLKQAKEKRLSKHHSSSPKHGEGGLASADRPPTERRSSKRDKEPEDKGKTAVFRPKLLDMLPRAESNTSMLIRVNDDKKASPKSSSRSAPRPRRSTTESSPSRRERPSKARSADHKPGASTDVEDEEARKERRRRREELDRAEADAERELRQKRRELDVAREAARRAREGRRREREREREAERRGEDEGGQGRGGRPREGAMGLLKRIFG